MKWKKRTQNQRHRTGGRKTGEGRVDRGKEKRRREEAEKRRGREEGRKRKTSKGRRVQ